MFRIEASNVAWGDMRHFQEYTAKLTPWFPTSVIPLISWFVTVAETSLSLGLITGFRIRLVAFLSGRSFWPLLMMERSRLLELLGSLSETEWGRVGHHPAFGALNLRQWVQFFLLHEAHHLYVALVRSRG